MTSISSAAVVEGEARFLIDLTHIVPQDNAARWHVDLRVNIAAGDSLDAIVDNINAAIVTSTPTNLGANGTLVSNSIFRDNVRATNADGRLSFVFLPETGLRLEVTEFGIRPLGFTKTETESVLIPIGTQAIPPGQAIEIPILTSNALTPRLEEFEEAPLSSIEVRLDVSVPRNEEFSAKLIAPNGIELNLVSRPGGGTNHAGGYAVLLDSDDPELKSIQDQIGDTNPNTRIEGIFRPQVPLSSLHGLDANGPWKLWLFSGQGGTVSPVTQSYVGFTSDAAQDLTFTKSGSESPLRNGTSSISKLPESVVIVDITTEGPINNRELQITLEDGTVVREGDLINFPDIRLIERHRTIETDRTFDKVALWEFEFVVTRGSGFPLEFDTNLAVVNTRISRASFGSDQYYVPLGDINRDGFDDLALSTETDLQISLGKPTGSLTTDIIINGGGLSATSGDFDGDREVDLFVRQSVEGDMDRVFVFRSIGNQNANLELTDADFELTTAGRSTNGYLSFTNDLVVLPNSVVDGLSDLTVTFQANPREVGFNDTIFSTAQSNADNNAFTLVWVSPTQMRLLSSNGQSALFTFDATDEDRLYQFALTRDATNDEAELFIDGLSVGKRTLTLGQLNVPVGGFVLGQEQDSVGGSFDPTQTYVGDLDEFAVWNRLLSGTEIAQLNPSLSGSEFGLNALYKFDETVGSEVIDSSGNQPAGSLGGPSNDPPIRRTSHPRTAWSNSIDLNEDGLDELLIPSLDAVDEDGVGAGTVYVIEGQRERVELPSKFEVLENFSVSGSGSFVVGQLDGELVKFDNSGQGFSFDGEPEKWFRFTTLGRRTGRQSYPPHAWHDG